MIELLLVWWGIVNAAEMQIVKGKKVFWWLVHKVGDNATNLDSGMVIWAKVNPSQPPQAFAPKTQNDENILMRGSKLHQKVPYFLDTMDSSTKEGFGEPQAHEIDSGRAPIMWFNIAKNSKKVLSALEGFVEGWFLVL